MPDWWYAEYKASGDKTIVIEGVSTNECPVSVISRRPTLMAYLELISRNRHVVDAIGSPIFGGDISQLPAKFVDACQLVQIERITIDNKMVDASQERLKR